MDVIKDEKFILDLVYGISFDNQEWETLEFGDLPHSSNARTLIKQLVTSVMYHTHFMHIIFALLSLYFIYWNFTSEKAQIHNFVTIFFIPLYTKQKMNSNKIIC